jgi:hypothetical protein
MQRLVVDVEDKYTTLVINLLSNFKTKYSKKYHYPKCSFTRSRTQ